MGLILLVVTAYVSWKLIEASLRLTRHSGASEEDVAFGIQFGAIVGLIGLAFGIAGLMEPIAVFIGLVVGVLAVLVMAPAAKNTGWAHAAPIFGLVYGTLLSFIHVPFGYNLTGGLGLGILAFVIIWAANRPQ